MALQRVRRSVGRYSKRLRTESAVRFGLFRRLQPISENFGLPRGKPIDRVFIEHFLDHHAADIRGRVLEAGPALYAQAFGGDRVQRLDVLYPKAGFPDGTLVGDLETGEGIPDAAYDCLILTQVFTCTYDVKAAVENSRRALKPGGILLATVAGIGQLGVTDRREWGVYWRFTDQSITRLAGDAFGDHNIAVEIYGNVYTACALLQCLAADDLTQAELYHRDPAYQQTITLRAVRAPE
jgi:hypothetical protein